MKFNLTLMAKSSAITFKFCKKDLTTTYTLFLPNTKSAHCVEVPVIAKILESNVDLCMVQSR